MILNKALLLKGLGGFAAIGGAIGLGVAGKKLGLFGGSIDATLEELVANIGLSCDSKNICTQVSGQTTNIKQDTGLENKTIPASGAGKIKIYKDTEGYNEKFKFVIEEGDITFNGDGTNKLEQFETYEIKKENGKWYFYRKDKAEKGIKTALGLPSNCNLPENTDEVGGSNCSSISADNLKEINFDGKKDGGATFEDSGEITLTITKTSDTDYPFGYKFTIQPSQKLTISTNPENSIAPNISVEFKIKKTDNSNQISLEKAWSLQTLAEKVGLENCNSNNECSIKDGSLNIKQDNDTATEKSKSTQSTGSEGKIKVYKDTSNHKEGFKFVIEDGDITLSNGSGTQITKLEQFETYEIEESGGKYYLSRKNKAFKEISKALGLPNNCDQLTGNTADCSNLNKDNLKGINFEGKGSNGEVTINDNSNSSIKLKVTKLTTPDNTFPHGYKFVLESNKEITFTNSTPSLTIKKDTNTEFKIKVTTAKGSKTLSLEKAWDITKLAEKVGLSDCNTSNKECTLKDNSINVKNDDNNKIEGAKVKNGEGSSKKLKYEEDQEGYNQGIKFYLEGDNDITLTKDATGSDSTGDKTINKKGNDGTGTYYEIKEDGGTWYLTKKTTTQQGT